MNAVARKSPKTRPRPTAVNSRRPPTDTVGRLHYRRPSPDELLPLDESGLRAALVRYGAELEYDPDGDMIIGFHDRERALASAKRVRRCHALAAPPELAALTRGQLELLMLADERRLRMYGKGRPRPSIIREAIRAALAKDVKTPSRKVAREIIGMPGIVFVRGETIRYRDDDDKVIDVKFKAFANLVSQERQRALRPGR